MKLIVAIILLIFTCLLKLYCQIPSRENQDLTFAASLIEAGNDTGSLLLRKKEIHPLQSSGFIKETTPFTKREESVWNFRKGIVIEYKFSGKFPVEFWEEIVYTGVESITSTTLDPVVDLEAGWFFEFFIGAAKNFSVVPELVYSYTRVKVLHEQFPPEYYESAAGSSTIGISSILIPLSFRYSFNAFRIKPFLETGFSFTFPTKGEGYRICEKISPLIIPPDIETTCKHRIIMYTTHLLGYRLGGGIKVPVEDVLSFDFGIYYAYNKQVGTGLEYLFSFHTVSLYLGFVF